VLIQTAGRFARCPCLSFSALFSQELTTEHAAENFADQTQAESLYDFIGRTSNYKSLTKDSVQGCAEREDADANGMKRTKEVKL
jgi:hypothetical protein